MSEVEFRSASEQIQVHVVFEEAFVFSGMCDSACLRGLALCGFLFKYVKQVIEDTDCTWHQTCAAWDLG